MFHVLAFRGLPWMCIMYINFRSYIVQFRRCNMVTHIMYMTEALCQLYIRTYANDSAAINDVCRSPVCILRRCLVQCYCYAYVRAYLPELAIFYKKKKNTQNVRGTIWLFRFGTIPSQTHFSLKISFAVASSAQCKCTCACVVNPRLPSRDNKIIQNNPVAGSHLHGHCYVIVFIVVLFSFRYHFGFGIFVYANCYLVRRKDVEHFYWLKAWV